MKPKKKPKVSTKEVADSIARILMKEGIKIQMYEAKSTNSIYLKFDFGMANTLRISDHRGKPELNYMFNLDKSYNGRPRNGKKNATNTVTSYYYMFDREHFKLLIQHIWEHRLKKIEKVGGWQKYQHQMALNYHNNKHKKGFWSEAVLLD